MAGHGLLAWPGRLEERLLASAGLTVKPRRSGRGAGTSGRECANGIDKECEGRRDGEESGI